MEPYRENEMYEIDPNMSRQGFIFPNWFWWMLFPPMNPRPPYPPGPPPGPRPPYPPGPPPGPRPPYPPGPPPGPRPPYPGVMPRMDDITFEDSTF